MSEGLKFSTPTQELEYLRSKVLEAEKKLEGVDVEAGREKVVRESIAEFKNEAGVGAPVVRTAEVEKDAETLLKHHQGVKLEEMMALTEKKVFTTRFRWWKNSRAGARKTISTLFLLTTSFKVCLSRG